MTRSWKLTLTSTLVKYNLWTLITGDASFTDPTFTTASFVPSKVCELIITGDSGAVSIMEDAKQEVPHTIAAGTSYIKRASVNAIDLKSFSLNGADGVTVDVSITAL